jgi:hypothetical protein
MRRFAVLFALLAAAGSATAADTPPAGAQQFDFILGEWKLDVHPKVSGLAAMIHGAPTLVGSWRAWRVLDGRAIEDELRIVDGSGNPVALNRSLRIFTTSEQRWQSSGIDAYHGRASAGSGTFNDGELKLEGRSSDAAGNPVLTRTRFFAISADAFRMQQDRSTDNGQTWEEGVISIDAKRTAASATGS